MNKKTRGIICLIIVLSLLLTQSFGMLTSHAANGPLTNQHFFGVTAPAALYPPATALPSWGWSGVSYTNLSGGGTNISYSNFGSLYHCVGITKAVKFDGLDLMLNIDTTKATAPNDQYFYINFCNGIQQNFFTNPFAIRINRTIGQIVLYSNGGIIAVLGDRAELMNTTQVRVQTVLIEGTHYVVVNGMVFGVSTAQLNACNNFNNLDATYVTVSPAENNTNFSMDIVYLRGGESPDVNEIMANVPAEQASVNDAADTIDMIDAIGTVTVNSGSVIAAAQSKYDALGSYNGASYKTLVFNYQKLLDATSQYNSSFNRYFFGVTAPSALYPPATALAEWGWSGVSYTSLSGGGTNISYNNFGSLYNCVGINKAVKFDGMDLMLNIDTTKATAPNDQYFYINFCNGLQQNFFTNPFAIRINRTSGQIVLFINGGVIAVLDSRPELMNTTQVRVQTSYDGVSTHTVNVNGLNFGVSTSQLNSCNNFNNLDATYVTVSPAENNTNFSMDVIYLRGGESPNANYIMSDIPSERANVLNALDTVNSIDAIGTVTVNSGSVLAAAQSKYDALGTYNSASYKTLVFNYQKLIDATTQYKSKLNNQYFFGVTAPSALYPPATALTEWGWSGVSYTSLPGGGTNISYSNFGSLYHCIGINKAVKFDGMDLLLNIDTTKAPAGNDQYFYVNFCNGLQQNFFTNPFAIRINRTIGQVVLFSNGSPFAVLGDRPEIINTTQIRIQTSFDGISTHTVSVNGLNFGVSTSQLAACNNFTDLDKTYVTVSPAENNTNFSMDVIYLRGGESPDVNDIMANVPTEQYQVVNAAIAIDLIDAIGTVDTNSGSSITAARGKFDILGTYSGKSYKYVVNNSDKLLSAEKTYFTINWTISGSNISGLSANTRADATSLMLNSMNPASSMVAKVFDGESEAAVDKIVGTGMSVKTYQDNVLQNSYTAIIYGDVSGDGVIDITDLADVKNHILKNNILSNAFATAGDLTDKGRITINDLLAVKKHIVGISPIVQH